MNYVIIRTYRKVIENIEEYIGKITYIIKIRLVTGFVGKLKL